MKIRLLFLLSILLLFSSCNDKKVISAFGFMNEKLEESNVVLTTRNETLKQVLDVEIIKHPKKYRHVKERSERVSVITSDYFNYLEDIKDEIYEAHFEQGEDRSQYEKLSSSKFLDNLFFDGNKPTAKGQEFIDKVNRFKTDIASALGRGFSSISSLVNARFRTDDIKGKNDNVIPWLNLKFKGFPAITSITNITQMQSDIRQIESELFLSMISGEFEREMALRNFIGIVELNKNAYLEDEVVKGKIRLGRYDTSVTPENVIVNGTKVDEKYIREGEIKLNFKASGIGEHPLAGVFTVLEEGEPVQIRFNSSYSVIRKYRYEGSDPDNPVEIIEETTAATPKPVSKPKEVRKPVLAFDESKVQLEGTIKGEFGYLKMSKSTIKNATIGALHYDSNKKYKAVSFAIKIDGSPAISIKGNRLDKRAKKALEKVRRNQRIKIYDIKVVSSSGSRLDKIEPITIKIK
jgi:gliding motility-associated protein GldM